MRLIDLMGCVLYNQRIQIEFEEGIVFGAVQVLSKVLDSDRLESNVGTITCKDDCLMVVIER